jgi:hypothetical protein
MALSVASYTQVSNWENQAQNQPSITGVSWSAGDAVVVLVHTYDGTVTSTSVTNANLTFSLATSAATGGSAESYAYIYTAIAGSSQTGQTIALNWGGTITIRGGAAAIVVTGNPSGFANASSAQNEAAFSKTVSAGSVCIYAHTDFNVTSGKTGTTGSGTYTERRDAGTNYTVYIGDWVGTTAGTQSFGITSYAGTKVGEVFIEVLDAAATVNSGFFTLIGAA